MPAGLVMHAHPVRPRIGQRGNKFVRILDHQMAIEGELRHLPHRRHHRRTKGDIGHEMAIHHIQMDDGSTTALGGLDLVSQMREVGGKN